MKRAVLTLAFSLCAALVAARGAAQENLSKRVLVYLDLSGSMKPLEDGSPFSKTAEALQLLLNEPGFLGKDDEVHFLLFGDDFVGDIRWPFGSAPGTLLPALRSRIQEIRGDPARRPQTAWTDLQIVLENLRSQLSRDVDFNRQVVVVASDFLHEPSRCGPKGKNLAPFWQCAAADWQKGGGADAMALAQSLANTDRNPILLGVAPLLAKGEAENEIREQVLAGFSQILGVEQLDLGAGGLDSAELAQEIRRRLYFPLKVEARSDRKAQKLQIDIENPNAAAVQIERIQLTCFKEDGKPSGDPIDLAYAQTEIAKPLAPHARLKDASIDLGGDSCLSDASSFKIDVESKEGAAGSAQRDAVWIEPERVESSEVESNFFPKQNVWRLAVKMRGDAPHGTKFQIVAKGDGERDGLEIIRGVFDTPRHLDATEAKRYLFVFDIPERLREQIVGAEIQVQVAMAEDLTTKPAKDEKSSHGNNVGTAMGAATILGAILIYLADRRSARKGFFHFLELNHHIYYLLYGILGAVPVAMGWLRPWLLESRLLSGSFFWTTVAALCLGSLTYGVRRSLLNRRFASIASSTEPPPDEVLERLDDEYRKPWYWAFAMVLLVCALGGFLAPKGSEGAEPIPVTIVAELANP
jgi:hypothetical protein